MIFHFIVVLWSSLTFAQEGKDLGFRSTQRPLGTPYTVPTLGMSPDLGFLFSPSGHAGISKLKLSYSSPFFSQEFAILPLTTDSEWIEVKKRRLEAGLGFVAAYEAVARVGLVPYKGAYQSITRHKKFKDEKSLPFKMPKDLSELHAWNVGDYGRFQTYGGVTLYAGAFVSIFEIINGALGIQNQFLVEVKKTNDDHVMIKISEEDIKSRQLRVGPFLANASTGRVDGHLMTLEFILDLKIPEHHDLYSNALKGNLHLIQERLSVGSQKLSWIGFDRQVYFGIPVVAGKTLLSESFYVTQNEMKREVDVRGSTNHGYLTPTRNHQRSVTHAGDYLEFVWESEMTNVNWASLERNFLSLGRILGVRGFDRDFSSYKKFGSVISKIKLNLSTEEISSARHFNEDELMTMLKEKCEEEKLSCRKERKFKKLSQIFSHFLRRPWKEIKREFGVLLLKEPVLIHVILKTSKRERPVYFKFLSENYQSLEGTSPIEI